MDNQILMEAAGRNDTTDTEAELVNLSPDVPDQLIQENLVPTVNQDPDSHDETGLADGEVTNPTNQMAPINRAGPNTRNGREFVMFHPPEGSHEHTVPGSALVENIDITKRSVLMGFFGIMSGSTFAAIFTLKGHPGGSEKLIMLITIGDIFHFSKWPVQFYVVVLLTVGFTVSLVVAVVSIWSMFKEWSFGFMALVFVAVTAFFLGYCIALKDKVPKFSFGTQSFHIPSYWLVWFYGFALVFLAVAIFGIIWAAAGRILSSYRQTEETA